ncbi:MAG: InlB B-repeat-containing protein [Clostridia bacterium]|nr:InlB B-repeat-containing protein [Clostridia bacterium]
MYKGKRSKAYIGFLLIAVLVIGSIFIPLGASAGNEGGDAVAVARGKYYDLPEKVENYVTSGKTIEFDLSILITDSDVCKLGLYDGGTFVSSEFFLRDGADGLSLIVAPTNDGWYHYTISLASVPHSSEQENCAVTRIRARSTFPDGTYIRNISVGIDVRALPEAFTEDYDTVTLADLGIAGTDYKTAVSSGTYTYKGKSETKSVIVKFGWEAKITSDIDWKLALDTYWNANCMVWFRPDAIYFCPGDGQNRELYAKLDPVTSGRHEVEFGRLRVVAGPDYGKDYVFFKIDGEIKVAKYSDYYQTEGGYIAYNGKTTVPSYTVCFVNDGVLSQGFSGFAEPDKYVADIDYVNIGDIVPGGVVRDTIHDQYLGYTYPFEPKSETHSTVVRFVLKTGKYAEGNLDGSVMVVDIGGNCGFCRSYISSGNKKSIMFGWEIEGCSSGTKSYKFEENTWYAFEQGRLRVTSGAHAGKDYVYIKIDGQLVSSFYGEPDSRPFLGDQIYVEATQNFEIVGYNEARARYYVDDELYLDRLSQKGFTAKKPSDPKKEGSYFLGWYTAKTGGTLFDFANTKLTGDINLYARFTTDTVTVKFDPANGSAAYNVTAGKNCLVPEQNAPAYTGGQYEYVFAGWKNETTGKIFDFANDRLSENTTLTAQYTEKEYFVSYYANGKLVAKVPFVMSDPTVAGKEPAVPGVRNATGVWESHAVSGLKGNMTVNADYTVTAPSSASGITLQTYSGGKIYLNSDIIHDFLSTDTAKQSDYVREFCASPHEYQDYQNAEFKWSGGGKNSRYTAYFADNSNFDNAYIFVTENASLIHEAGVFIPGKTYYWFVCGNDTGECSAVDSFTVVNTPIRYISAGNVINMRDLGGQVNADGDKVKYELVYRGAALDEYTSHVDDVAREVFDYLGMNSEIELRGGMNHSFTGWDENNPNVHYITGAMYQEILSLSNEQKEQYKSTFEAMADINNYPFYFHCSAGADRTGTFAYLLYGLLGVSYDDIRPEYELTSFSAIGVRPADDYHQGFALDTTNELMIEQYGGGTGNLQTAIENFLKSYIGLSGETLEAIKNIMLDKGAEPNEKPYILTVDVLGEKYTYQAYEGIYFMPDAPQAIGKLFKGFYNGKTKYTGYAKSDLNLVAEFEDIQYEPFDTLSLRDLGVKENKIINQTNTVYTYEKTAKSGGRVLQFIMEPIGDMNGGDGPQISFTNNWDINSYARVWFQTNDMSYAYYNGVLGSGPDVSKMLSLEAGKQYKIVFAVRVMKNKGYEGKKVFEVTVDGKLLVQYIGCKADLSDNLLYFHGGTGAVYLINDPVYKTVRLYNGNTLIGTYKAERSGLLPKVEEPAPQNGVPFAGWYTEKTGGELWDENADVVIDDMDLYARFANVRVITAKVGDQTLTYRVEVGKTLESLPRPKLAGNVFTGWTVNGKPFTGTVSSKMTVTAAFEPYSFDDYDELSLRDLGISGDLDFAVFGERNNAPYTYYKAAKTGGRVFKAIYIPTKNMMNGPQVSFSQNWSENYYSKLYFTKYDMLYVYSSGVDGGLPTLKLDTELAGGKEYYFEIGVRVLNNKGYKGVKVLTVYLNGELIFEEFDNGTNLDTDVVFFQGLPQTGIFRNVDIYKTVSFYDGEKLLSTKQVLRGKTVNSIGKLADKGERLFGGWATEFGVEWDFDVDCVYLDTVLKAKFQKRTYPVLLTVDGILYKRLNIAAGESADIFDIPIKDGYEFDKWLSEDGGEYDIKAPVNAPLTLAASFKPVSATQLSGNSVSAEDKNQEQTDFNYILFGIIGIVFIAAETGVIIYKKRSKK